MNIRHCYKAASTFGRYANDLVRTRHLSTTFVVRQHTDVKVSEHSHHTNPSILDPEKKNMETTARTEPAHIKVLVDQIANLKFHEIVILNEALKRELKIPDIQTVVAAGPAGNTSAETGEEETAAAVKSAFTVKLTKFEDTKKVALIKEIKKLVQGINLVEAKRFVEECPKIIRSNITKAEAEELKKQLEDAGGTVVLE